MDQEIRLKVPGGTLIAWADDTGESCQAGVMYQPDGDPQGEGEIDLFLAEVKGDELAGKKDNDDIDLYLYDDPYTEDYTRKKTIRREDFIKAIYGEPHGEARYFYNSEGGAIFCDDIVVELFHTKVMPTEWKMKHLFDVVDYESVRTYYIAERCWILSKDKDPTVRFLIFDKGNGFYERNYLYFPEMSEKDFLGCVSEEFDKFVRETWPEK